MTRSVVGVIAALAGMVLMLQDAPRVLFDFLHADQFVPAEGLTITNAECTNWNIAIFDHCKIQFESRDGTQSGQLDDWKFGRAPTGRVELMQWQDDPTVVTTDMSLDGVTNRLTFVAAVIVLGVFAVFGIAKKAMSGMSGSH
jgi:hypothetical protein